MTWSWSGKVAGAHGIGGLLRILSYTHPAENLLRYVPWSFLRDGAWRVKSRASPERARRHDKGFLCRVDGVHDREAASALRGVLIGVPETALPEPDSDEYYWRDLIGLDVVSVDGDRFGRVENLHGHRRQRRAGCQRRRPARVWIPFIESVIEHVDLRGSVIVVDWERAGFDPSCGTAVVSIFPDMFRALTVDGVVAARSRTARCRCR